MADQELIVPFGKYKGQPIEAMAEDQQYIEWLMEQSWFKSRYGNIYKIVINNFCAPSETPEHNAMQVKFLDPDYAMKVACAAFRGLIEGCVDEGDLRSTIDSITENEARRIVEHCINQNRQRPLKKYIDGEYREAARQWDLRPARLHRPSENGSYVYMDIVEANDSEPYGRAESYHEIIGRPLYSTSRVTDRVFEDGCDVAYYALCGPFGGVEQNHQEIRVEIKPSVGDDFPAVLREIRRQKANVLLLGQYAGVGATRDQFIQLFRSQGVQVVFDDDVDDAVTPYKADIDSKLIASMVSQRTLAMAKQAGVLISSTVPVLSLANLPARDSRDKTEKPVPGVPGPSLSDSPGQGQRKPNPLNDLF